MFPALPFAFLLLIGVHSHAQASEVLAREALVAEQTPELALLVGWRHFIDDDVVDTYGGMPSFGLRFLWPATQTADFYLSAQYGRDDGNPYYDTPDFEGHEANRLVMVPLQMGFRWNVNPLSRFAFYVGFVFEAVWARERYPSLNVSELESARESDGMLYGFQFTFGPEWQSAGGERAAGLEVGYGESGGELGKGESKHDLNLTAFHARAYYALGL